MKIICRCAAVVCLIVPVAGCDAGSKYGVDEANPIGTLKHVGTFLVTEGMRRGKEEPSQPGQKSYFYLDIAATMKLGADTPGIDITAIDGGAILALYARVPNDGSGWVSTTEEFLMEYWQEITGGPPVFRKTGEGEERSEKAEFSKAGHKGYWRKQIWGTQTEHEARFWKEKKRGSS
ncbi:MAG: hypothetical protein ACYTAF_02955 [Planctomycetota bacterium]|jgi:hypothetical protein